MTDIKLYGYSTSPFVRKVGCVLNFKKIDFEFVAVNPFDPSAIAFTEKTQVPVLKVGEEWRLDSTPLGLWLDELYPEVPILGSNEEERKKIIAADEWVSNRFIPAMFRTAIDGPDNLAAKHRAWRLAAIVNSQSPLPEKVRNAWPTVLRQAPFILSMVSELDRTQSLADMFKEITMELVALLDGGPFLAGQDQPSLADLALFPQLIFPYMVGLESELAIAKVEPIKQWFQAMRLYLPDNPLLVPDYMIVEPQLPWELDD